MSVRIKEMVVQDLGPVTSFRLKPGILNLIYGHNEKGKTHLVEFLIRSLFRNLRQWSLRPVSGKGKIFIEGMEKVDLAFSPASRQKLDELWGDDEGGLPRDFSKLLVVKGAELELASSPGGADRKTVLEFLSGQDVLKKIEKNIPVNIQTVRLNHDDMIPEKNMGEVKERKKISDRLVILDRLWDEVDSRWSRGTLKMLQEKMKTLSSSLDAVENAKKYHAFQLDKEITKFEKEIKRIDEQKLGTIRVDVAHFRRKEGELRKKNEEMKRAEAQSRHFAWLEQCEKDYTSILESAGKAEPLFLPLMAFFIMLAAGVLLFLKMTLVSLIVLSAGLLAVIAAFWQGYRILRNAYKQAELKKIESEFQSKFQEFPGSVTGIRSRLRTMEVHYKKAQFLKEQLDAERENLDEMKMKIDADLSGFDFQTNPVKSWEEKTAYLEGCLSDLRSRMDNIREQFHKLQIDQSDFITEAPAEKYSRQKEDMLIGDINVIREKMETEENNLRSLKDQIIAWTGDPSDVSFEVLMDHLNRIRLETEKEYQQITASILGKKAVYEIIQNIRKDEDRKINEALQSEDVSAPLRLMTGRYHSLSVEDDKIIVHHENRIDDFLLSDLSTGAREQVLLALRIGLASRAARREGAPLFLILDDAFQYSDYVRRENLMKAIVRLAEAGWQIIYFTMDDHIKKLFDRYGKPFAKEYVSVELA